MKTILVALFILLVSSANAQTPETKFLQKENVRWAAFISDTIHFNSPNLSLIIRKQADEGKIKVAHPGFHDHVYDEYYLNEEQLRLGADCILHVPLYDSLGNLIEDPIQPSSLFDSIAFDIQTNDQLFVEQFLYIKKDKPFTHVSWVSPKKKILTSYGEYLGNTLVFNAYHNTAESVSNRTRKESIFLGTTNRVITDSMLKDQSIKQWFGQNFAQALWPTLSSSKVDIYWIDSMKKILPSDIFENFVHRLEYQGCTDSIEPILYSNIDKRNPLNPVVFTQFSIKQDWYYNFKKEVVFNDIGEIILYARKTKNEEPEKDPSPILRIVYK